MRVLRRAVVLGPDGDQFRLGDPALHAASNAHDLRGSGRADGPAPAAGSPRRRAPCRRAPLCAAARATRWRPPLDPLGVGPDDHAEQQGGQTGPQHQVLHMHGCPPFASAVRSPLVYGTTSIACPERTPGYGSGGCLHHRCVEIPAEPRAAADHASRASLHICAHVRGDDWEAVPQSIH